ncbi:MAG: molybdopterin dehydrogenase [Hyphomicrobiales bacterium]|nr:MAG: molybdopterin dehydrogenase [Hyphomicrobiales bacterium]
MKPNSFEYVRVDTLNDAIAVLQEHGDDARILAGGQSLIPAMNMRLALPEVLVDVSNIGEMHGITIQDGGLRIGAMSRHAEVMKSSKIAEYAPLITMAMPNIAHGAIRNRGTFGGSLCNADPAAELPACALALGVTFNIQGSDGTRSVAAEDFIDGTYSTCLSDDEILVSVDVPAPEAGAVSFFEELARRKGDYAMAGLAAHGVLKDGQFTDMRLVFFAVDEMAVRASSAEQLICGKPLSEIDIDAVCAALADDITPFEDLTTSSAAKMVMMQVLTRRTLEKFIAEGAVN